MARLQGKTVLITGAALGLGRATALRMAEEGAAVAVTDVLEREGAAFADELTDRASPPASGGWTSAGGDVAQVIDAAAARFGRLDILVNNAGVAGANKPTDQVTEAEWDFVQAINVKGVFFCTQARHPAPAEGGGGSIINLSSIYGLVSAPDVPPYHASKGAVRLMTKTDALIYAPEKIR
jgi:NAD(P)-dependent dehydrogenase (short-subunit alcohol dehydrogenase family)